MTRYRARFLVFLFALLQCVAPLLHAHVHAEGHGGVHLPGMGHAPVHAHALHWAQAPHADDAAAVGLSPALKPRADLIPALLDSRGPGLRPCPNAAVPPLLPGTVFVLPGPPPYLIPLPGPPPTL
ncbi:MAG: hypothetical protein ACK4TK_08490 [Thiobacillaceae bacterium]